MVTNKTPKHLPTQHYFLHKDVTFYNNIPDTVFNIEALSHRLRNVKRDVDANIVVCKLRGAFEANSHKTIHVFYNIRV